MPVFKNTATKTNTKSITNIIVLAIDTLEFTYKGKPAHAAAAPHEGINALDAVIMLFNSINALRQQLKQDVRIHGNVTKGGDAVNIIPETAEARFYIRSQQRRYLNEVVEKVKNCARGAALRQELNSRYRNSRTLAMIF